MGILILAEKPSVARSIAGAVGAGCRKDGCIQGNGYTVTWCFGHLLKLYDASDYDPEWKKWTLSPVIPERFRYKPLEDSGARKQYLTVKALMRDPHTEKIISATDNDREGQLIADEIISVVKPAAPVYRLLVNDWTPENILAGLESLSPNEDFTGLRDAGACRQRLDWLIGINLTRGATVQYKPFGTEGVYNIGRVICPTLKFVYDRDTEIEKFKPKDFFRLEAVFRTEKGESYSGVYKDNEGNDRFDTPESLPEVTETRGRIVSAERREVRKRPPALYNQTNLQADVTAANEGWTSDRVLAAAQSLYEKGYLTYPRTASRRLEEAAADQTEKLLDRLVSAFELPGEYRFEKTKRVFDSSKVDSHSAIVPTMKIPADAGLTADEKLVYETVRNVFCAQFLPPRVVLETKAVTRCGSLDFHTTGNVETDPGYTILIPSSGGDNPLPDLHEGDTVRVSNTRKAKGKTTPPKPVTEKDILRHMETAGKKYKSEDEEAAAVLSGYAIGTDATRAETIRKLVDCGYLKRSGKTLRVTQTGRSIVETVPVEEIFDADYTGRIEYRLKRIEKNLEPSSVLLNEVKDSVRACMGKISADTRKIASPDSFKCPVCGGTIIRFQAKNGKFYYKCSTENCVFTSETVAGKKIPKTQMKRLFEKGKTGVISGFKSRKGTGFDAALVLKKDGKIEFEFQKGKGNGKRSSGGKRQKA